MKSHLSHSFSPSTPIPTYPGLFRCKHNGCIVLMPVLSHHGIILRAADSANASGVGTYTDAHTSDTETWEYLSQPVTITFEP